MAGKLFPFSTALVTGASNGIGQELARQRCHGPYSVILVLEGFRRKVSPAISVNERIACR